VLKFLKDPRTSKEVRNLAFAHFTPDEFPTHRMLQELMMLDPMGGERDQIMEIATLILPWCRDGNYGCLFDGTSNLSLTGKIAHFELGYIPESAKELKAAAGFLITNHARKHIMTLLAELGDLASMISRRERWPKSEGQLLVETSVLLTSCNTQEPCLSWLRACKSGS
jgi:hypothetical protein